MRATIKTFLVATAFLPLMVQAAPAIAAKKDKEAAAAPAAASSIAWADPALAITKSQARTTAFQQVDQVFGPSMQRMDALNTELETLKKSLDTDGDNNLSETEIANAQKRNKPTVDNIVAKETEVEGIQTQVMAAQLYAIEQIRAQYNAAQDDVAKARRLAVILRPDAFYYIGDATDVTDAIVAALNVRVPTATITPPEGWQPTRATVAMYQEIGEILQLNAYLKAAAAQQAQQQQQQQQGAAPVAPAEQPESR